VVFSPGGEEPDQRSRGRSSGNKLLYAHFREEAELVEENGGNKHEGSAGTMLTPGGGAVQEWFQWLRQKVRVTLRKTRGGGSRPPPPFSLRQTLLTFVGAFSTLLMVTRLSFYMTRERGSDYRIVLG
jgi:hypothetical protein